MASPELQDIFSALKPLLNCYAPPLIARWNSDSRYELWSEREIKIDGRTRDDFFFAGINIRSRFVSLYYMPMYTDPDIASTLGAGLLQCLNGRFCFHFTALDTGLIREIEDALRIGYELYHQKKWV